MSESYLMVIPATEGAADQTPLITAEDPERVSVNRTR
jgi:hypothetical protein